MERDEYIQKMNAEFREKLLLAKPFPEALEGLIRALETFRWSKLSADGLPEFAPKDYCMVRYQTAEVLAGVLRRELEECLEDQEAAKTPDPDA